MRPTTSAFTATPYALAVALAFAVTFAAPGFVPAATATTGNAASTANIAENATDTNVSRTNATAPTIVAVYPDPVTDGDAGEFVVAAVPPETNLSGYRLADGETTARFPNETVSGRVALSPDPDVASNRTDVRVLGLDGGLSLSNAGETVRLVGPVEAGNGNRSPVSSVTYPEATEGERWHRVERRNRDEPAKRGERVGRAERDGWRWTPLGATDFEVASVGPAIARTFVLPDAPGVPLKTLQSADERILLAGYTFASPRIADALVAATRRGVAVRVLVEGGPVGGITRGQSRLLDDLARAGVAVRVVDGPLARYDYHHPKYAVADDRALVLTENWKPSGTGGRASRGWGVVLNSDAAADHLTAVFDADAGWRDAKPWREFRRGRTFESAEPADESYPAEFDPERVRVESGDVVVAPDNAEASVVSLLDSADESIRVQQVAVGSRDQPFLRAAVDAARRGVEVRVLLSSAWYVEEDNRALVEWLNERAKTEELPLTARLADPRGRYEKIHAKGVVVDGEAAVVGSLNWNNNSARENREVAVVLRGADAAGYYGDVFDADWKASGARSGTDGIGTLPVGLLAGVAVGALAAILLAKREVRFEK